MCTVNSANLEYPIGYSVHERNLRLLEKLVADGYVVEPILQASEDPSIRLIDHLKVSASNNIIAAPTKDTNLP
jgi:hypothetical protein